ncbi:hypothetical protein HOLleu_05119 [Holothuria leucospilota]|uniref:Uncharacterized protein n=1 Tax=Holothuria leucospilota TaxID=206669 RepID=A0A9Q1CJE0_HOLLE|nr:hypothetical protein HOLleu_05119 [Holothuria leucospilota]
MNTLTRGEEARKQFQSEWDNDSSRFKKSVKHVKVQNFASESIKKRPLSEVTKKSAEGLRDMFICMIIIVSQNTSFDLRKILSYPITEYPLSLANCDGTRVKTNKSTLLKKLESFHSKTVIESELPKRFVAVYKSGLVLYSILSQTKSGTSFASISRKILLAVCSNKAREVHLCLDKYGKKSIKDSERRMRSAVDCAYVITGPEQTIKQNGKNLLNNGVFKNEVSKFLLKEWRKGHYCDILGGRLCLHLKEGNASNIVLGIHKRQSLCQIIVHFNCNCIPQENPLESGNVKRINCALLPPSRESLAKHLFRVHYITILWTLALLACPSSSLSPTDYGWHMTDKLEPIWFDGPPVPQTLFKESSSNFEEPATFSDAGSEQGDSWSNSDSTWREDSSSDED